MPVVAKLTFINRESAHAVVVLRHPRRHFRLVARFITNLVRLPHPAPLWLKAGKSVHVKMPTHLKTR